MSRSIEKLKALTVERLLKRPGMYCDGGGLWLCVSSANAASWIFRYQLHGKAREMGLGSARDISLQEARTAAAAARKCKAMGSDPLQERERIAAGTARGSCSRNHVQAKRGSLHRGASRRMEEHQARRAMGLDAGNLYVSGHGLAAGRGDRRGACAQGT